MSAQYGPATTTDEVIAGVNLHGRVALVTGASSGIGAETARTLAGAGAQVVLAVRDTDAGEKVASSIREQHPDAQLEVMKLDLTSLASVRAFADAFLASHDTLDLLINNAGVMATPFERTSDGFELQFGTNHLGHFLLTNLLMPALDRADGTRVVNVTSAGHRLSDILWDDPNYEHHDYDKWQSYGQSKTANILLAVELERRFGGGRHAYAVHPGMIATRLGRYLDKGDIEALMSRRSSQDSGGSEQSAARVESKSVEAGAATSVFAATAPELADHGGAYLEDCHVSTAMPYATDPDAAQRLWTLSEELVCEKFP
jgi:NAD(P)-dependent dehydrogenase (short-subunit alcohol dehydrogenase family)